MNAPTLAALTAIALTLGAVFFWNRAQRPKGIRGRTVLSLDEIYDRFYRDSGFSRDDVRCALDVVARAFGVKSGLLRPTDRFGDDLKVPHGWDSFDSPLDELSDELRSLLGVDDAGLARVETVDDVVRAHAANLARRREMTRSGQAAK